MTTITIADTIEIPLGRAVKGRPGKYGQMAVAVDKFTSAVHDHVYTYGLRQLLNDAIAEKTDDEGAALSNEALVAKAQKRLDTLYSGELRARGVAEPADPVEAELHRMARAAVRKMSLATPEYAETKGEKDRVLATINARSRARGEGDIGWEGAIKIYLTAKPGLRKVAERIVRERAQADMEGVAL